MPVRVNIGSVLGRSADDLGYRVPQRGDITQRPVVVDAPLDKGHVVSVANNLIWRAETLGGYFFVFNAILSHDNLNARRQLDPR